MEILNLLLILIIALSIILLYIRCDKPKKTEHLSSYYTSIYTPSNISDYALVDKGCWNDDSKSTSLYMYHTITPFYVDMRRSEQANRADRTYFINDAYITTKQISIKVPDNLLIDTINPALSSSISDWNKWALTICHQYNFDTVGYLNGYKMFFGKKGSYNNYTYLSPPDIITYDYTKKGQYTGTCAVFGSNLVYHVFVKEIIPKTQSNIMINNYLKFPGACRTDNSNNYPPYTQYANMTLNDCETKSRTDSNSSGFSFSTTGYCQIFDPTNPQLKGSVPTKTPIIKGNSLTNWDCYIKPISDKIYYTIYNGSCMNNSINIKPVSTTYPNMTFNECEIRSRYDSNSNGFAINNLNQCVIYNKSVALDKGNAALNWTCYIK